MASLLGLYRRINLALNPAEEPAADGLKFGILGAANIAPIALIRPVKNHPDAVVYAVAARSQARADEYAKKWGIEKAYGGQGAYQKLLDDPEVDVVYNPLPNGLHYEWTMKALAAGKHVLLEKPSADTAEETRKMFELAEKKGVVLMEAFHYRFHPAIQRVKEIVSSGSIGAVKSIHTSLCVPKGIFRDDTDIRFDYALGGGALMDAGCYPVSCMRYLASTDPIRVTTASADTTSKLAKIDLGTSAEFEFPGGVKGKIDCHLRQPGWGPFQLIPRLSGVFARVVCEEGEVELTNFPAPWFWHTITIKGKDGKKRTEKCYGKEGWTTYRYQLEAFIDKIRGRTPQYWYTAEDSVANMVWIENVYTEVGLGPRPASTAEVPTA